MDYNVSIIEISRGCVGLHSVSNNILVVDEIVEKGEQYNKFLLPTFGHDIELKADQLEHIIKCSKKIEEACKHTRESKWTYSVKFRQCEYRYYEDDIDNNIDIILEVFECTNGEIRIPDFVTMFGEGLFYQKSESYKIIANNLRSLYLAFEDYAGKILDLTELNIANISDFEYAFTDCKNLVEIDFGNQVAEKIENVHGMIDGCINIKYMNICGFKLDKSMGKILDYAELKHTNSDMSNLNIVVGDRYKKGAIENIKKLEENGYSVIERKDFSETKMTRVRALKGIVNTIVIDVV